MRPVVVVLEFAVGYCVVLWVLRCSELLALRLGVPRWEPKPGVWLWRLPLVAYLLTCLLGRVVTWGKH